MATGRFADPEKIVTAVEGGLEKGAGVLLPDRQARLLTRLRRFAPRLLWKVILEADGRRWHERQEYGPGTQSTHCFAFLMVAFFFDLRAGCSAMVWMASAL